jgi:hypothetical protein
MVLAFTYNELNNKLKIGAILNSNIGNPALGLKIYPFHAL